MKTFERADFDKDQLINTLFPLMMARHATPDHTMELLAKNEHVKNFCVMDRHFIMIDTKPPIYLHYETSTWLNGSRCKTKFDRIVLYDSFEEYEPVRLKALHSTIHSSGVCLN